MPRFTVLPRTDNVYTTAITLVPSIMYAIVSKLIAINYLDICDSELDKPFTWFKKKKNMQEPETLMDNIQKGHPLNAIFMGR